MGRVADSIANCFPLGLESDGQPVTMKDMFTYDSSTIAQHGQAIKKIKGGATERLGVTGEVDLNG